MTSESQSALALIQQRHKSPLEADFLDSLFQQYRDDVLSGTLDVCLFGAGSAGEELAECLQLFGITPRYFCVSSAPEEGAQLAGVPIIHFEDMKADAQSFLFVVASNDHKAAIKQTLISHKMPYWCSLDDDAQFFYYLQIYKWHHPLSALDTDKLQSVYDLLEDESSKGVYLSRINLVTSYPDYGLFTAFIAQYGLCANYPIAPEFTPSEFTTNFESYLYFNNDVIELLDEAHMLDAGAFDGDSALEFVRACERQKTTYSGVICVEADSANFQKLIHNTSLPKNTDYVNRGLWSEVTTLSFASSEGTFITESRIVSSETKGSKHGETQSDTTIETTTIDALSADKKISFIKMDIEGAELHALEGARQTLQRDRPTLVISLYHSKSDIYEIPLLIKAICPAYRFAIRHFSQNLCETVLLAQV